MRGFGFGKDLAWQWADFEIRTKLIDDQRRPNPRFRSMAHGTAVIVREEGIFGIYRYMRLQF